MALSGELLRRLDQEVEPLPKRLRLALAAFESNDLPVQRKEELILNWLCEYGEKNRNAEDIWSVLKACFNSSHMKKLSGANIRPPVKYYVSQILCELLKSENICKNSKCVVLECAVCVLENTNFQHFFKRQLEQLFDYISLILNVINEENVDCYTRILQTICVFNKQVFQKELFSVLFIQKILQPIIKVLEFIPSCHATDSAASHVRFEIFKCVQQVLFPKSRSREMSLALMSLFVGNADNHSAVLKTLFECLSSAVVNSESDVTVNLFSIVLQAFVSSYKGDTVCVHRMFITLCYFVGFKPEVKFNSDDNYQSLLKHKKFKKLFPECHIKKAVEVNGTSLKVTKNLLVILSDANIPLNDSDEVPFEEWLQALIPAVFSSTSEDSISVVILEVMCAFIHLKPLIFEPKTSEILEHVMLAKKQTKEIKVAYVTFFCDTLKMFVKLSRLQKFVAKLLNLGTTLGVREVKKLPALPDILPSEFCTEFQIAVGLLPGGQTVELMRTLMFHLNQDCVAVLEKQQGDCPLLIVQIISKLMCHFLRGTRVADHSVPAQVASKFSNLMTGLQDLLGKLGQALLHREHNCLLMVAFLQLCYNWGELRILSIRYSVRLESDMNLQLAALQEDISATNLSYLHPYLCSELWNLVAQRIGNFGEADCKELLVKLILQKLRAVFLYVDSKKTRHDTALSTARHLVSHIRDSWPIILTGTNALLVVPFMNPEQLECLANHIVQEISSNSETSSELLDALKNSSVQENRLFISAFTCAALKGIMKLFSGTKRKRDSLGHQVGPLSVAREVLAKIDPFQIFSCLSKNDPEALTPVLTDMANIVNEAFQKEKEISVANGWKLDMAALQRYLHILKLLPLQHTPSTLKSVVVVSVIALVITLEGSDVSREEEQFSNIRSLLFRNLLLGILDSPGTPDICSYLNMGWLTRWMMSVDLPLSRDMLCLLFQRLFESCLSHSSALPQLQDALPILQKQSSNHFLDEKALEPSVTLLKVVTKCPNQHENSDDHSLCLKYQRRLSRGIIKIIQDLNGAIGCPVVSDGFNLVLIQCLKEGDAKQLEKLTPHLGTVINTCLSQVQSKDFPAESYPIKSSLDILATLLQYKAQLQTVLPPDFICRIWAQLASLDMSDCIGSLCSSEYMQLVFEAATEKELYPILQDLKAVTKSAIQSPVKPQLLKARLSIWKSVIQSKFSDGRNNARKMALEQLCHMLIVFVNQWGMTNATCVENSILPVLELLLAITQNSILFMSPEILDLCFESVGTALTINSPETLPICFVSLRLLQTLMKSRESLVLDRIPSLLQCYRQVATTVAAHSHVDLKYSPAEVKQCAVCAHRLERLTNVFKEYKPHFARVAAYIVADFLQNFETYTLYPEVKIHYSNCIHSLLSICDSHAILFLSRTLTPASQLLLKTFYDTYKKFHRFTGKV